MCKQSDFWAYFRRKIMTFLSINSTFLKLATQNARSTTETVLTIRI